MDPIHKFLYSRRMHKQHVYSSTQNFVPFACHYNENTLLTKNGELIQSFRINGITSDSTNDNLLNLRSAVRQAIRNNNNSNIAYWIHNIRHCINIDDSAPYNLPLADFIHQTWRKKNHLDNKFVNTLYISIVHNSYNLSVNNLGSFLNSLSLKFLDKFHDNFLDDAINKLSTLTQKTMEQLKEFDPHQLAIQIHNSNIYSELLGLYNRVMHANWDLIEVKKSDSSLSLDTHQYSFGANTMQILSDKQKKFAAMISIKEYQEIQDISISRCMNVPVELVATEIFHLVHQENIPKQYKQQSNILLSSQNSELIKLKNIESFIDSGKNDAGSQLCNQQISIMVVADSIERLEARIITLSNNLTRQGIIHVREDINLEQTFWAQLPGNFKYIKRFSPNSISYTAALATLYQYHIGRQNNLWGRAVTILRTELATPYFMNFHNKNNIGHTCVAGVSGAGCTTIMNFLLSESSKYNPNILYLTTQSSSQIFINAMNGTWYDTISGINALLTADYAEILECLKIITGHYTDKLNGDELVCIKKLARTISDMDPQARSLQEISKIFSFESIKSGESIKDRISSFIDDGKYSTALSSTNESLQLDGVNAINLHGYTDNMLARKYFDQNKEYTDEYYAELEEIRRLRSIIVLTLIRKFVDSGTNRPKILVVDGIEEIMFTGVFIHFIEYITTKLTQNNGIVFSSIKIHKESDFVHSDFVNQWLNASSSKIILPIRLFRLSLDIKSIFQLSNKELNKLKSFPPYARLFIIKQSDHCVAVELNLEGFLAIKKFLSANAKDINIFHEIKGKSSGALEWVNTLYKHFQDSYNK